MNFIFTKILPTLLLISAVGIFGMMGIGYYWQYQPASVSDYVLFNTPKNAILNKDHIILPGEVIRYAVDTFIVKKFVAETTRYIVSNDPGCDQKIFLPTTQVIEIGQRTFTNASFSVPLEFKPCTYHLRFVTSVQVNPNKKIEIVRESDDFIVPAI